MAEQGQYKGQTITVDKSLSHAEQVAQAAAQLKQIDAPTTKTSFPKIQEAADTPFNEENTSDTTSSGINIMDVYKDYQKSVADLTKNVMDSKRKSPEEQIADAELANLQRQFDQLNLGATQAGVALEGQGMDTAFIQGRQGQIEKARAIQAQKISIQGKWLEAKLARLQEGRLTEGEIAATMLEGVNHQFETALKLQQLTMPNLLDTIVDKTTGEITGLFQDMDGNVVQRSIGMTTPETVAEFDIQTTWNSGGRQMAAGITKDGKFETRDIGPARVIGGGGSGGSGVVGVGSGGYYESIVERELAGGASITEAVTAAKIIADELGDKVSTNALYTYAQNYKTGGGDAGGSSPSSGADTANPLSPFYTPPKSGASQFSVRGSGNSPLQVEEQAQPTIQLKQNIDFEQVSSDLGKYFANF